MSEWLRVVSSLQRVARCDWLFFSQRQRLRAVPVSECAFTWKNKTGPTTVRPTDDDDDDGGGGGEGGRTRREGSGCTGRR